MVANAPALPVQVYRLRETCLDNARVELLRSASSGRGQTPQLAKRRSWPDESGRLTPEHLRCVLSGGFRDLDAAKHSCNFVDTCLVVQWRDLTECLTGNFRLGD